MLVTLSDIVMLVSELQPLNAQLSMLVTGKPLYVLRITMSVSVQVPIPATPYDLPSSDNTNLSPSLDFSAPHTVQIFPSKV